MKKLILLAILLTSCTGHLERRISKLEMEQRDHRFTLGQIRSGIYREVCVQRYLDCVNAGVQEVLCNSDVQECHNTFSREGYLLIK